ncbi:unnamed protein product [Polarella glacialis]|uniref:V-type proton ATPase subunit E n=1 Tax=Polarella glacialis TaxID=89957 RepID=A0A813KT74_POLGL|nr:unnamed protein product [Polarella glacialis]
MLTCVSGFVVGSGIGAYKTQELRPCLDDTLELLVQVFSFPRGKVCGPDTQTPCLDDTLQVTGSSITPALAAPVLEKSLCGEVAVSAADPEQSQSQQRIQAVDSKPSPSQQRIQHMCDFILAGATVKASDIVRKGEEEFSLDVDKLITEQKQKVRKAYELRAKQVETSYAIAKSMAINKQRLEKIKARQEALVRTGEEVKVQLAQEMTKQDSPKKFLTQLIVQGLLMLLETEVVVRCRQSDSKVLETCLQDASAQYATIIKTQTGAAKACKLSLDNTTYLSPAPIAGKEGPSCLGGVVLHCQNGNILIDNTIDTRLKLVMEQAKPAIRGLLFPAK